MRLDLRCICKHGYGTHVLARAGSTVVPVACRARGCPCLIYELAKRVAA